MIDEARSENQSWEKLCRWGFIVGGGTALLVIIIGAARGDAWIGATSAVPGSLCFWLIHSAMKIRRENVTLRLLEVAFNNVTTAGQAAEIMAKAFQHHFGNPEGKDDVVPKAGSSP